MCESVHGMCTRKDSKQRLTATTAQPLPWSPLLLKGLTLKGAAGMQSPLISLFVRKLPTVSTVVAGAVLVASCSSYDSDKGSGAGVDQASGNGGGSCELPEMRTWVNDNMNDYYLFSDQVDQNVPTQAHLLHNTMLGAATFYVKSMALMLTLSPTNKSISFLVLVMKLHRQR